MPFSLACRAHAPHQPTDLSCLPPPSPPCPHHPAPQLATLSRLQRLRLASTAYDAAACGALAHLPALTELHLAGTDVNWAWCMCHCTGLRRLSLKHCLFAWMPNEHAEGRAVPELRSLTQLECSDTFSRYEESFGALPSLPALRQLVWWERWLPPLPASWTALTRLELPAAVAKESAAELQAARAANPALTVAVMDEEVSGCHLFVLLPGH